jgi:Fe-S cluster biosynthesis and repair protein YggX
MWEERMKMILNEYKLLPFQKEAQALITRQMEEFLFGEDSAPPPGFVQQS